MFAGLRLLTKTLPMVTRHLNCVQVANNCLILVHFFFIKDTTFVFILNTGPGMLIKSLTLCGLMDFIYLRPPDKSVSEN